MALFFCLEGDAVIALALSGWFSLQIVALICRYLPLKVMLSKWRLCWTAHSWKDSVDSCRRDYFSYEYLAQLPFLCQFVLIFVSPLVPQCLRSQSLSTLQTEPRWVTSYLHKYHDNNLSPGYTDALSSVKLINDFCLRKMTVVVWLILW